MEIRWITRYHGRTISFNAGTWPLSVVAIVVWCAQLATCDIDFPHFSRDPQGKASHMRVIGGASVDYYSTEFNELCPDEQAPAIYPPVGMTQRFQHPEFRHDPHYEDLPEHRYLADDQLDNPFAGRIDFQKHTEVVVTKAFIPDDDRLPLPHNRTQLCHYALRLTPPANMQNTAAWFRFKQQVAYGFVTEFHFRILHRQRDCLEVGKPLQYCQFGSPDCEGWCQETGGDGFAFVVQNFGRKAVGSQVNGMGYGFRNCLAIEFDTLRNVDYEERSGNHISVHVPTTVESTNSANHLSNEIAYSDDIPPLTDGTHVVRIEYNPRFYDWDDLGRAAENDNDEPFVRRHLSGRAGLLIVELDGHRVINVPVDINQIAQVDNMISYQADPPTYPDINGYDEGGSAPGRAWVGFTSSTSYSHWQSVDILSWTFEEKPRCPYSGAPADSHLSGPSAFPDTTPHRDGDVNVTCRVENATFRGRACTTFGDPFCSFIVRNIARQPIKISGQLKTDKPFEGFPCLGGILEWDMLHPYFLGCRREVYWPYELLNLQFLTLDGTRSILIDDPKLLQKDPTPFVRRSKFEHCIMEHKYDLLRLYFAECNCEYCVRVLDVQLDYSVFYNDRCTTRYNLTCPCFEASEVAADTSSWIHDEPLQLMRLHTCRGCAYPSHCAQMLKVATCDKPPYQMYTIGNPLAPVPLANGFQNLLRDGGKVDDGRIYGDSCNCEPDVRPYRGDPDGRKGVCSEAQELDKITTPELDGCAAKCANTPNCRFLNFWDDGVDNCKLFFSCPWILCTTTRCMEATVYRLAPLGQYINTRGQVQQFRVFPLRIVQTSKDECMGCLNLYSDYFCLASCGPGLRVPYLHWPGGQSCATCIFAGNRLHELTAMQTQDVKQCVYDATRIGQDPWVECEATVQRIAGVSAIDLFNGVNTHFLSECPGRNYNEIGAVCAPNLASTWNYPSQVLSRQSAKNDTVWDPGKELECLNAVCDVVPRADCYIRLAVWGFNVFQMNGTVPTDSLEILGMDNSRILNITREKQEGVYINPTANALLVNKENYEYFYSEALPFALENNTLEVWAEVDSSEEVKDVSINVPVKADSKWEDDYGAERVVDGNMETYWSSQVGEVGERELDSIVHITLPPMSSIETSYIYWKQPAADFSVHSSQDNLTWLEVHREVDNTATLTVVNQFYVGSFVKIIMTKAATVRASDPGKDRPVYSIYEFEAMIDSVKSRLKPTHLNYVWNWHKLLARDNDAQTYWASLPGVRSVDYTVDFGSVQYAITVVTIQWRFKPMKFSLKIGNQACSVERPQQTLRQLSGVQINDEVQEQGQMQFRCLLIQIDDVREVRGEYITGIYEVDVRQEGVNLAATADVLSTYPEERYGSHISPIADGLDGNPATYFMMQPSATDRKAKITLDLGNDEMVISVKITWGMKDGFTYYASWFITEAGMALDNMEIVDEVSNNFNSYRRFVLYRKVRYMRLNIEAVMSINDLGRFILEDWIIHAATSNTAALSTSISHATSEWADCSTCHLSVDGENRYHGPHIAVDGDLETWYGAAYPANPRTTVITSWTVTLDSNRIVNLVVIRWKYPATTLQIYCANGLGKALNPAGYLNDNYAYLTPMVFTSQRTCRVIQIDFAGAADEFAGELLVGIKEIEVYNAEVNVALDKPVVTETGDVVADVTDISDQTFWQVPANNPITIILDLQSPVTAWGIRTLWAYNKAPGAFMVSISNDNINWQTLQSFENNYQRDVYTIAFFTARYVKVSIFAPRPGGDFYTLRTLAVYNSANYALGATTSATGSWNHTGWEAIDGINTTFWISEPLATTANLRVDMLQEYFIGSGVHIRWMYPAEDFSVVYLGENDTTWKTLYQVTGNLHYYNEIQTNFYARYVEIRMTRPSALNGDGSYAIWDFDIVFDPNLAHGKNLSATYTINPDNFKTSNAIDGVRSTIWMPMQGSDLSEITFDLGGDLVVSSFEIEWRHPPKSFALFYQDVNHGGYVFVNRWDAAPNQPAVWIKQTWVEGFVAKRVRIMIIEVRESIEGKLCSLRDVLMHTFLGGNNQVVNPYQPAVCSDEIVGNPCRFATDGNVLGTYWMPGEGIREAWIEVHFKPCNEAVQTGRTSVWWRWAPGHFTIEFFHDIVEGWYVIHEEFFNNNTLFTDFFKFRTICKLRITVYDVGLYEQIPGWHIGIFDIAVYPATAIRPNSAVPTAEAVKWKAPIEYANDLDTTTYWMAPAYMNGVEVYLDLGQIYDVYDINIWFVLLPQTFDTIISTDGINEIGKGMTSTSTWGLIRLEVRGTAFPMRYLRIRITASYLDPEVQLGSSIRDIAIYQFRNLAEAQPSSATNVWSYPAEWAANGESSSWWMSRFGATEANLVFDLGEEKNIAGISFEFQYAAGHYTMYFSSDNTTWNPSPILNAGGNTALELSFPTDKYHFRGRYVKLRMKSAVTLIDHPDQPGVRDSRGTIFALRWLKLLEHTGGGGVVGIQSLDGSQFNTIAWGQLQPGEWQLSSEEEKFTKEFGGGADYQDIGRPTHIAVTFKTVHSDWPPQRAVEITMYRNGLMYGTPYISYGDADRLRHPFQTRMIFGVRSSYYPNNTVHDSIHQLYNGVNPSHSATHTPYFFGKIYNATLIQNALSPEEVMGLYAVTKGGTELGCHCYDACPFGVNRFNRSVLVPCSGQGVCLRNHEGRPLASGSCQCLPGFSGEDCSQHCSDLSPWGCCKIDDDCPSWTFCNTTSKACQNFTSR